MEIIWQVLLPVVVTISLGFVYARIAKVDLKPIAHVSLYILTPALVFSSLLKTSISVKDVWDILVFSLLLAASLAVLAGVLGKFAGLSSSKRSAIQLSTVFMNGANYGLPVVLFALGEAGFARAVIFVIIQTFLMYSLGVYFAAGGYSNGNRAIKAITRMPTFYAAIAALALRMLPISVPEGPLRAISLLGEASIPVVLLLLGMQLAYTRVSKVGKEITLTVLLRLIVSPLIAMLLVYLLGIDELTGKVLIIESAMPTAVIASLLAVEFNREADLVSSNVFVTTILSLITVSLLLYFII